MQEYRLPRVIHHLQNKRSIHIIGNKYRQRKAIVHKRADWSNHSIPEPDLANIKQIININTNSLNIIQKRRSLSEYINNQKAVSLVQLQNLNKKVFILNQTALQYQQNEISDLKTFKSLLNSKSKTPKRLYMLNGNRKLSNNNRSFMRNMESLWEINENQQHTTQLKPTKNEDFLLEPWNDKEDQKENINYYDQNIIN